MEEAALRFSHLVEQDAGNFQELPLEVLQELLGNDHLEVSSEDTVLNVPPFSRCTPVRMSCCDFDYGSASEMFLSPRNGDSEFETHNLITMKARGS